MMRRFGDLVDGDAQILRQFLVSLGLEETQIIGDDFRGQAVAKSQVFQLDQ